MTLTPELASSPATPPAIPPRLLALETSAVPPEPHPGVECGFTAHARRLAQQLCIVMDGQGWQAATRSRYEPHPRVDQRADVVILIDGRRLVTVTHFCPAGTTRDLWAIRVDGRLIAHRVFAGEIPHTVEAITRSVWRHLRAVAMDPCDTLRCPAPAVFATWGARSMCGPCARRYAETGQ